MEYFIYNIENLTDSEYEKWFSLMTEEKQERVCRYKDSERRKCSVAGEKLIKEYIGKALNISPEALVILTDKNGKPYIQNCPIHFNISHCENILVYAFSDEEIGIDIEKIRPISLSILKRFYSEKEQDFVLGKASNECKSKNYNEPKILENFYRIYTLKEAICKKSGLGIKGLKTAEALPFIDCSFKENNFIISIV
ncbi:MAG: 4'-phosphopantetheinyl transferase superfamily protein [Acutalibacteraceae bacterium]|nr:4'-phosphopantetheinyl transferase superfamily protein [Acutalibacteraceae bacterium]